MLPRRKNKKRREEEGERVEGFESFSSWYSKEGPDLKS
jgi:hypothetical protein